MAKKKSKLNGGYVSARLAFRPRCPLSLFGFTHLWTCRNVFSCGIYSTPGT